MNKKTLCLTLILLLFASFTSTSYGIKNNINLSYNDSEPPNVIININPYDTIYEGEIIKCNITGETTIKYWQINQQKKHTMFYENNPVIFDPEPTPLKDKYVNLTVTAENEYGIGSDTIPIILKRIYFGDIHWHTFFSDGIHDIDTMYENAIKDNYLDFTACTDHAELLDGFNILFQGIPRFGGMRKYDSIITLLDKLKGFSEWQNMKDKAIEYYQPGSFSTLIGFEWTAAEWSPGGHKLSPNGCQDVGHINFYYRDIYQDVPEYSDLQKLNYDSIFKAMADEWRKGHLNIGYPHHPQGKASWVSFTTNWTFLARKIKNTEDRDLIIRGAEIYSRWGSSIGQHYTPNIPWCWPYRKGQFYNQTDSWVENALWEWSNPNMNGKKFSFIASSDTHEYNRPGSAMFNQSHIAGPSGIMGAYAIHNTREEIWDSMNNCTTYATQLLKIRAYASFDDQPAFGSWINCTQPLTVNISAISTFHGQDNSGKNMSPHGYSPDELDHPITDIWLVKKDCCKERPWCTVIGHEKPNTNFTVVTFNDPFVKPNDFYYVVIRQRDEMLSPGNNEYLAFLGPAFIDNVE